MAEYSQIPVVIAKEIAELYAKSQVVILAWDAVHMLTHVTTYGVSAFDKENAAAAGELLAKTIGVDMGKRVTFEDFHRDYDPAIYKEALDLLTTIRNRNGCTPPMVQKAERILKAAGRGVRQG
jgi:hypothetical protein